MPPIDANMVKASANSSSISWALDAGVVVFSSYSASATHTPGVLVAVNSRPLAWAAMPASATNSLSIQGPRRGL